MLKLKHKSAVRSTNSGGASYRETYYGTRGEVEARSRALSIGDRDRSGDYELTAWRTRQIGGPIYEIELVWENLNAGSNLRFLIGRHGPKEHTLDITVMPVPLEDHPDYRTNWNYCLAAKGTELTPEWWETATDPILSAEERIYYRWVKTPSGVTALGENWHLLKMRTMNCESWLSPSYTITELSRHCRLRDASWAAAARAGKICMPELGDFETGIESWLNLGGQIYPDGRRYVAKVIYKASPYPSGWDERLYEKADEEEEEETGEETTGEEGTGEEGGEA